MQSWCQGKLTLYDKTKQLQTLTSSTLMYQLQYWHTNALLSPVHVW